MSNKIEISVDDKAVQAAISAIKSAGADMKGPLGAIGRTMETRIGMGFRNSVSPWGDAWADLKSRDGRPLVDTGRLKSSISTQVSGDPGGQYVEVGTNVEYAPYHQFGATIDVKAKSIDIYRSLKKSGDFAHGGKFVKKAKSNFASTHAVPAHKITIPARPFLPIKGDQVDLPKTWSEAALREVKNHFKNAMGGGA
jgi:phage gpG-like protein